MKNAKPLSVQIAEFKPAEGHRVPVTRRELLAAGLIQGAVWITLPSVLSLISRKAYGLEARNLPAYLEINAAGGAAFHANVAPLNANRDRLSSYERCGQGMGLDITQTFSDNTTPVFANKVAVFKNSGMYQALDARAELKALMPNTYLFTIPGSVISDTNSNMISAQGLVQSLIPQGLYLPSVQTQREINRSALNSAPAPLVAKSFNDVADAIGARSSDTLGALPTSTRTSLVKFIKGLNSSQAKRLSSRPGGVDLQKASEIATGKVETLVTSSSASSTLDPRAQTEISTIWNIAGAAANNASVVQASVVHAIAQGYASSGGLSMGGYDYHGNSRAVTNDRDKNLWNVIGNSLLTFAQAKKPALIFVTTDGTVGGAAGPDDMWTGDSNNSACTYILVYSPTTLDIEKAQGLPDTQIGQFTAAGVSDLAHPAANPRGMAISAFLNYANLAGLRAQATPLLASSGLAQAQLQQLVRVKAA